jgi:hypothetical protein
VVLRYHFGRPIVARHRVLPNSENSKPGIIRGLLCPNELHCLRLNQNMEGV